MEAFRPFRIFLFAVIGSLAVAAAMGILVFLVGRSFPYDDELLGTMLTITLFSLTSLGCAWAWERGRWRPVAAAGIGLSAISFLIFLLGLWWDYSWGMWEAREWVFKLMGVGALWSILCAHLCLLSLARLKRQWRWVFYGTGGSALLFAAVLSYRIFDESHAWDADFFIRVLGILAILAGCGTICAPILHRLSAIAPEKLQTLNAAALVVALTCPRCAQAQQVAAGRSKCHKCGLKFRFEIEEETCATCGYSLYGLTSDRCPECGTPIVAQRHNSQ